MLLDGRVVNGTALNATAATGSARNGNLGPGAILVNGTTTNGTGADLEWKVNLGFSISWLATMWNGAHLRLLPVQGCPGQIRPLFQELTRPMPSPWCTAGVSGTAYPITAITPNGIVVNRDNGVNITGMLLPSLTPFGDALTYRKPVTCGPVSSSGIVTGTAFMG